MNFGINTAINTSRCSYLGSAISPSSIARPQSSLPYTRLSHGASQSTNEVTSMIALVRVPIIQEISSQDHRHANLPHRQRKRKQAIPHIEKKQIRPHYPSLFESCSDSWAWWFCCLGWRFFWHNFSMIVLPDSLIVLFWRLLAWTRDSDTDCHRHQTPNFKTPAFQNVGSVWGAPTGLLRSEVLQLNILKLGGQLKTLALANRNFGLKWPKRLYARVRLANQKLRFGLLAIAIYNLNSLGWRGRFQQLLEGSWC